MKPAMHLATIATSFAILLACSASAQDDEDPNIRRSSAPAVPAASIAADGRIDRLEFDFGRNRGKAWLARKGELYIETWVQHRGFLCATYEVGVRFGHGDPGCANVQWLAPAKYVTSRRQCNNAVVQHVGGDTEVELSAEFDRVTCAQRMIRCASGNC